MGGLMLAASAGGHLDLLRAVAPAVDPRRRAVWVTSRTSRGQALRASGEDVELVPEYGRDPRALLVNLARAAAILARRRPRLVVTSGAGVVVPLCLLARLTGARLVHVETMARVTSPSATGRLLSRLASRTIVQWPELVPALPRATVCEPALLDSIPEGERAQGNGTFVAVGTHAQGFPRLLEIVARAVQAGVLPRPVVAQTGPSSAASPLVETVPFIGADELRRRLSSARVVVCHAGAGIIAGALAAGHTPIVAPRRAKLGEHVDDHQRQLAGRLADGGLVVEVDDGIGPEHVAAATRPLRLPARWRSGPAIAEVLRHEVTRAGA